MVNRCLTRFAHAEVIVGIAQDVVVERVKYRVADGTGIDHQYAQLVILGINFRTFPSYPRSVCFFLAASNEQTSGENDDEELLDWLAEVDEQLDKADEILDDQNEEEAGHWDIFTDDQLDLEQELERAEWFNIAYNSAPHVPHEAAELSAPGDQPLDEEDREGGELVDSAPLSIGDHTYARQSQ